MRKILPIFIIITFLISWSSSYPCEPTDYAAEYTACKSDNTRNLIYYLKPSSACSPNESSSYIPPSNVFNLPCSISCPEGYYLPLGSLTCSPCSPGSFSRGGSIVYDTWTTLPPEFKTYCMISGYLSACPAWYLEDTYIRSGAINDSMSSILELAVVLTRPSMLRFTYRVDAEIPWDFVTFDLDGVESMAKVSYTLTYTRFSVNVTSGYHLLRWNYRKDFSISVGDDAVFIESIEFIGANFADDYCTPCAIGSFANSTAATSCSMCPMDTFATDEGSSECQSCNATQFAYEGSSQCQDRSACTMDDFTYSHTKCEPPAPGTRYLQAEWLSPMICDPMHPDSVILPDPVALGCGGCDAGMTRDAVTAQCVRCNDGYVSDGGPQRNGYADCSACELGTAAIKSLNYTHFDEWMDASDTGCIGQCGTDGWRLITDHIDSGDGHGSNVDSWFKLEVDLYQPGTLTFRYYLNCSLTTCKLGFSAANGSISSIYTARFVWNTATLSLPAGPNALTWDFNKQSSSMSSGDDRADKVLITSIVVTGAKSGGAAQCNSCALGSVSSGLQSMCTNCSSGHSSNADLSQCVKCSDGEYSTGGTPCLPCGKGTTSTFDGSSCTRNCSYFDPVSSSTFDLGPLSRDSYYPEISDAQGLTYLIAVCPVDDSNTTCFDDEGNPVQTPACQMTPYGYGIDIGHLLGYATLDSSIYPDDIGIQMEYDQGLEACGSYHNGTDVPRRTIVYFICDETAGIGSLTGRNNLENEFCVYEFEWRSLYGCPLCSDRDWSYFFTSCENGLREQHFYWTRNPSRCHGGLTLPNVAFVNCSDSDLVCPAGQYSDDGVACKDCEAGKFSLGGGDLVQSWATLPAYFSSSTSGCPSGFACSQWSAVGDVIESGIGYSSLVAGYRFVRTGSLKFVFQVYAPSQGIFQFSIDGMVKMSMGPGSYMLEPSEAEFEMVGGTHTFLWTFQNGRRDPPGGGGFEGVTLFSVTTVGIAPHDEQCSPCPAGYSSDPKSSSCTICPANTALNAASRCVPCSNSTYSMPGSSACLQRQPCTLDDYVITYTPCENGERTQVIRALEPVVCWPPASITPQTVPCVAPPAVTPSAPGSFMQRRVSFFADEPASEFDQGWSTSAWRARGNFADSGPLLSGHLDSWLTYSTVISPAVGVQASITFVYLVQGSSPNGLVFLVDSSVVPISSGSPTIPSKVVVPLSPGNHTFTWAMHQEPDSEPARVSLSNITIEGTAVGVASVRECPAGSYSNATEMYTCTMCGPGSFSNRSSSVECSLCEINYYSSKPGATDCLPCSTGTHTSFPGSPHCETDCLYTLDDRLIDLSELSETYGPYSDTLRNSYYITPCRMHSCSGIAGSTDSDDGTLTHVCVDSPSGSIYDGGSELHLSPNSSLSGPGFDFTMTFRSGDSEGCEEGTTRSLQLGFECDLARGRGSPEFLTFVSHNCSSLFMWASAFACPACTVDDFQEFYTPCDKGQRQLVRKRVSSCNDRGGEETSTTEECAALEVPSYVIISVVSALAILLLVLTMVLLRNRSITKKYILLISLDLSFHLRKH